MSKRFLLVVIDMRKEEAVMVQKILTEWGCFIKTRLGLHENVLENCSNVGTIFMELAGEEEKHVELDRKLNLVKGVHSKLIDMKIPE